MAGLVVLALLAAAVVLVVLVEMVLEMEILADQQETERHLVFQVLLLIMLVAALETVQAEAVRLEHRVGFQ
jgi:hypothetical protein